jgi:hypothetical protein
MGSEGGRISRLVSDSRACATAAALAKARALYNESCKECKKSSSGAEVGTSSDALADKARRCATTGYVSPYSCVPESIRLQREQIRVKDCHAAGGPYSRVFPAPCPPTRYSPYVYDGSGNILGFQPLGTNTAGLEPIPQLKACPLPNKPYNPVLPG